MMHPRGCRFGYTRSILRFICIHQTLIIFISEVFELFILPILKTKKYTPTCFLNDYFT